MDVDLVQVQPLNWLADQQSKYIEYKREKEIILANVARQKSEKIDITAMQVQNLHPRKPAQPALVLISSATPCERLLRQEDCAAKVDVFDASGIPYSW